MKNKTKNIAKKLIGSFMAAMIVVASVLAQPQCVSASKSGMNKKAIRSLPM